MFRLKAASETVREAVPPLLVELFARLTFTGSVAFLVVLLSVLYWLVDRDRTATVIGYALVGLAVTLVLKEGFALPRPPETVQAVPTDADSHGFPSGHAIASTVVYGGLLAAWGRARDIRVAGPVATFVALVGFSRVAIGVHYLGDVLAGFAVGVLVLSALWLLVGRDPVRTCLVAAAVAVPAIVVTGAGSDSLLALGGGIGGAGAFRWVDLRSLPSPAGPAEAVSLVALGLAVAGGLYAVASTVQFIPVALVAGALFVASVVVFPAALRWWPSDRAQPTG